jgi:FkbM family methyltransferase
MTVDPIDCRIFLHHIGARGFGVVLDPPGTFEDSLVHVLYEADPECAAAMMAENKKNNLHVLPYCISDGDKTSPFYLASNPYASSLLKPNENGFPNYCEVELSGDIDGVSVQNVRYDAIYAKENRTVRTLEIETRSLDSLLAAKQLPDGTAPDFLSLDTQGSEYEILVGAQQTLQSTLAIGTEIEFQPMYEGQKLFSALFDFLRSQGFKFVRFTHLFETSSFRAPLGQRAGALVSFGDAIFIRDVKTLEQGASKPIDVYVKALKLAFLALNLGLVEHAMEALACARRYEPDDQVSKKLNQYSYVRFLRELAAAADAMEPLYLYTDRSVLVDKTRAKEVEQNKQMILRQREEMLRQGELIQEQQNRIAMLLSASPRRALVKLARHPLQAARLMFGDGAAPEKSAPQDLQRIRVEDLLSGTEGAPAAQTGAPTMFETVLANYGFAELAISVRERRLLAFPFVQT